MHLEIGQMPKWIGDLTTNRDADYLFKVYKYRYFVCLILKYKEIPVLIQVQILYQHYITNNNLLFPFRFIDIIDMTLIYFWLCIYFAPDKVIFSSQLLIFPALSHLILS